MSVSHGLDSFLFGRALAVVFGISIHIYIAGQIFDFNKRRFVKNIVVMIAISVLVLIAISGLPADTEITSVPIYMVVSTIICVVIYLTLQFGLNKSEFIALLATVRNLKK